MPKQNGQLVEAVKALRYLGTPVAAREMARRLTDDDDWASDFMFGLVGSPARDTGLREMKMLLIDPHFPASSRFLRTMAVMTLDPNATGDLLAQREEAEARFRQQLKSALKGKKGQALTVSANTVVSPAP
jgi:hypothetical protein